MVASLTGPLAESGLYQSQGAKLAVEEVNKTGGVLGQPIELIIEDDQTTNPGSVLAFSKLAGMMFLRLSDRSQYPDSRHGPDRPTSRQTHEWAAPIRS